MIIINHEETHTNKGAQTNTKYKSEDENIYTKVWKIQNAV